jgi:predicted DNA-binding transcriptional regulator YafY
LYDPGYIVFTMSRSERLFSLLQTLRRHRRPVTGQALARELGVSIRTLYRDIASLQAQGADIEGEPGLGYVLRPGFILPPLMFSEDEIEALVLGSRWVAARGDDTLGLAARDVLAKIAAVLPTQLRESLDAANLFAIPIRTLSEAGADLASIRRAIRLERKLSIRYRDGGGTDTRRLIWPFAVGFFDRVHVVVAWCELRKDYRHFRTDRIAELTVTDARYGRRRAAMLKEWRAIENIPVPL